jgi:tetratricopeptide (TPR) repeat protein
VVDVLLDAFAVRFTDGYAAAAPALARALRLLLALDVGDDDVGRWFWLAGASSSAIVALELWDAESWHALAARRVQLARDAGALVRLQFALNFEALTHLRVGELAAANPLIEEDRLIAEATGNPPVAYADMVLAAWRGREAPAAELIQATAREATAPGLGRLVDIAAYASALLYNGLGRYDAALDAARQAFEHDQLGSGRQTRGLSARPETGPTVGPRQNSCICAIQDRAIAARRITHIGGSVSDLSGPPRHSA